MFFFIKSLDFTVTRFLMKMFKSSNINLINKSRYYFNFLLPFIVFSLSNATIYMVHKDFHFVIHSLP